MSDMNLSNEDGERVNPATEDLQRELLAEFSRNSARSGSDVKRQVLTIGVANVAHPPEIAHGCNSVKFWTAASDMYYGDEDDNQPILLVASIWNEEHINNVGNLRFRSATSGTIVYIVSSN